MPPRFAVRDIALSFLASLCIFGVYHHWDYVTSWTLKASVILRDTPPVQNGQYENEAHLLLSAEEENEEKEEGEDGVGAPMSPPPFVSHALPKQQRKIRPPLSPEVRPYLNTPRQYEQPRAPTEQEQAFLRSCTVVAHSSPDAKDSHRYELCVDPAEQVAMKPVFVLVKRVEGQQQEQHQNILPEVSGVCTTSNGAGIRVAMRDSIVVDVSHILLEFTPPVPADYECLLTLQFEDAIGITESYVVRQIDPFVDHWPFDGKVLFRTQVRVAEPEDGLAERPRCTGFVNNSVGYWTSMAAATTPDTASWKEANPPSVDFVWQPLECRLDLLDENTAKSLLAGRKIAILGDSMMRTIFQAMMDILSGFRNPFRGQYAGVSKWCGLPIVKKTVGSGVLTIVGDGCHGGGAIYSFPDTKTELHYFSSFQVIHPTSRNFAQGLGDDFLGHQYDLILAGYGLHDANYPLATYDADLVRWVHSLRAVHKGPMLFVNVWAQNTQRKPLIWRWSGSHTKGRAIDRATRECMDRHGVPWVSTFDMMLGRVDASTDGVHYHSSNTVPLANLVLHNIGTILSGNM